MMHCRRTLQLLTVPRMFVSSGLNSPFRYLDVPSYESARVSSLGAQWDPLLEMWFVNVNAVGYPEEFERWKLTREYLVVPYSDKDCVKERGGMFDGEKRRWYAQNDITATGQLDPWRVREYIHVPYEQRDEAKKCGARWDMKSRRWYIPYEADISKFSAWRKQYIEVPYEEKSEAKLHGAKWDYAVKAWFIPGDADRELFMRWMPKNKPSLHVDENALDSNLPNDTSMKMRNDADVFIMPKVLGRKSGPHVVFYDVETTGLPKKRKDDKSDSADYKMTEKYDSCRIVQLGYMVCDKKTFEEVVSGDFVIKPNGFIIDNAEFHGITHESAVSSGIEFASAFRQMMQACEGATHVIAHNARFDVSATKSELYRRGMEDLLNEFSALEPICTMHATKLIVKSKNKWGRRKNPSLKELYEHATGQKIMNQHNAKFDVDNLKEAIQKLVERGHLVLWD